MADGPRGRDDRVELRACLALTLFLMLITVLIGDTLEDDVRSSGGVLELAGLATTALGLAELRDRFSGRDIWWRRRWQSIRSWARSVWRWLQLWKQPPAQGRGVGRATMRASAHGLSATGGQAAALPLTLEDRIKDLEQAHNRLAGRVNALDKRTDEVSAESRALAEAGRQARVAGESRLQDQIKDLAVGGLRLSSVGLVMLALGLTATTWTGGVARFLQGMGEGTARLLEVLN